MEAVLFGAETSQTTMPGVDSFTKVANAGIMNRATIQLAIATLPSQDNSGYGKEPCDCSYEPVPVTLGCSNAVDEPSTIFTDSQLKTTFKKKSQSWLSTREETYGLRLETSQGQEEIRL